MSQIFISYAREDQAKASALVRRFKQEGWEAWWDQELIPGEVWDDRIQKAVDEAQCVIVLWSTQSVTSEWVRAEAREGRRQKKLIPILLDQVKLPMPFSLIQSGKLMGWPGNPDDPRLEPLVAAVNTRLEGKAGILPRSDVGGWERSGQLKTKTSTLGMLVLPALLTGLVGWGTMNWKVPTKVDISLFTSHVDFTIRPSTQPSPTKHNLLDPVPIHFIQLEHFSKVTMVADSLEQFVDAQGLDPIIATDEKNWLPLDQSNGPVVLQAAYPGAIPVMQVEFFKRPGHKPGKGRLEALTIEGGTELALTVTGTTANQLTIDAWGNTMGAQLTVPEEFLMDLRNMKRRAPPNSEKREMKDGSYRVRVQPANGRLQIEGEPEERTIQKFVVAGKRVVMSFDLDTKTTIPIFGKEVLPLQKIRFLEGLEREETQGKVQAPDIFEGHVVLTQHAAQKKVPIVKNDILVLEDLNEDFHLQSLTRDPQQGALRVHLAGTVGGIRTGSAIDKRDLRLTMFEQLQGDKMVILLGSMVVVVLTTTVGGWRFWKELST